MSVFIYIHLDALFTVVLYHKKTDVTNLTSWLHSSRLIGRCTLYNFWGSCKPSSPGVLTLFQHVSYLQNDQVIMIYLIQSQVNCAETLCAPFWTLTHSLRTPSLRELPLALYTKL
ncbi:hypothetical protein NL108_017778 [Boleophthalmus pectinirostris]|nr:hypothetical protein NL108_017778 [Boleophthalmus pectinirostris]